MARFAQKYKGGQMGGGMGQNNPTQQAMDETKSMMNPTDLAGIAESGEITPDMSIRQFLEMNGMDVEGPVTQLVEWQMKQMENADPLNKMKAIAGKGGMPQGGANMQPQGQPPGAGSRLPQGRKPAVGTGIAGLRTAMQGGR